MSAISSLVFKIGFKFYNLLGFSKNTLDVLAFEKQQEYVKKKDAKVIFDVGARHGGITGQYRAMYPDAKIFAFEPFPKSYELLLKYADAQDGNVVPVKLGVSDRTGKSAFNVNEHDFTNSLLDSHRTETIIDNLTESKSRIEIDTITLDQFAMENKISKIDILKFDIQGGELNALKGAQRMLSEGRISLIYTEVSFMKIYEGQPFYHDISAFLYSNRFELINIFNPWYIDGRLAWADALFANKAILKK